MDGPAHRDRDRGLIALSLALVLGCREARQRDAEPDAADTMASTDAAELVVAVHGCDLLVDADTRSCRWRGRRDVSLWLAGDDGRNLELRLDGEPLAVTTFVDREGVLLRFKPRPGAVELHRAGARWRMQIARYGEAHQTLEDRVVALAESGALDQARAALEAGATTLERDEAALTGCLATRLAYGSDALPQLIERLRTSPAVGCMGNAALIAAQGHVYEQPDLNAAQQALELARVAAVHDFGVHLNVLFHQADLDLLVGRIDEALVGFDRVIQLATWVDEQDEARSAQVMKAIALARLGRFAEADALVAELEVALDQALGGADELDEIAIDIRYNMAWTALLRREEDPSAPDPTPALTDLIEIYRTRGDPKSLARTQLHLSLAAVQTGALAQADAALAKIDQSALAPNELVWLELVGARVALARRQLERAQQRLDRAEAFAVLAEDLELRWLTTTTRARLERTRGRTNEALAAYERAAELADDLALSVPGTAGRSMLVTAHGRADAEQVELLLGLGRVEQALCVAAGTRARHLRALWARLRPPGSAADRQAYQELLSRHEARRRKIDAALAQAWSLSAEQLDSLRARLRGEGEQADALLVRAIELLERDAPQWSCDRVLPVEPARAVLTMIGDVEDRRWTFLLARGQRAPRVVELAVDGRNPEALARAALRHFADELHGVEVLTTIPIGPFVAVDIQRLLLDEPTLAGIAVRSSLGLGRAHEGATIQTGKHAAVIVGAADLAAAQREAARVTERLRGHAWTVANSWSPTADAQPSLLHYSGHGQHSGLAGWGSTIEIPEFGPLSAAQIVATQRAPRFVVLGACSAGTTNPEIIDGGMNLAAAFLLAGAELVIAPSGPVDDDAALALAGEIYRDMTAEDLDTLARALVDRQREEHRAGVIEAGPRSSLRWRAWVP